ncbi:Tat (twin-arginine translocation) pathway signal sequence [Enhydrobacter aerosaccus]|uniref:Tat (Twin-arginine translocation) pathway signal sequence n=1 Tax=Enhydrobacter aerosaccus TaxID=225324 RepID=A0A1T4SGK5_9HYPH|nr:metallophosphoesterase [Enhydrobacter aerosaccus]SKA27460.1 Tat (twin-arginine translocation) pathway signal sequence [Enhydrobacter aerosaccus]
MAHVDRRDFLKLAGIAGVTFTAGLFPDRKISAQTADFHFVQFSDTHWGYSGPANPDAEHTLEKAVATVNGLTNQPDFIVFTGDLTHTTEDAKERRARMKRFREIVGALHVKDVRFMPGEHDASLDAGEAYKEFFGETHYTFDHKGVHFIALDNASDPEAKLGEAQLAWLAADLKQRKVDEPIVVMTHRPLFDLYAKWDWTTADGTKAIDLLMPYQNVVVFYGHIHQEHHDMTGHIPHHAAKSLIFPQPAPGSQPKRVPLPYDPAMSGLGTRDITMGAKITLTELPVSKA